MGIWRLTDDVNDDTNIVYLMRLHTVRIRNLKKHAYLLTFRITACV